MNGRRDWTRAYIRYREDRGFREVWCNRRCSVADGATPGGQKVVANGDWLRVDPSGVWALAPRGGWVEVTHVPSGFRLRRLERRGTPETLREIAAFADLAQEHGCDLYSVSGRLVSDAERWRAFSSAVKRHWPLRSDAQGSTEEVRA